MFGKAGSTDKKSKAAAPAAIAVLVVAAVLGVSPSEVRRVLALFGKDPGTVSTPRATRPAPTRRTAPPPSATPPRIPVTKVPENAVPVGQRMNSVGELIEKLYLLDKPYAVAVRPNERTGRESGRLFSDLPMSLKLHPSYEATKRLCDRFDPYNRSDRDVSAQDTLRYLKGLVAMAPLAEALRLVPGASVEDLQRTWFGAGRGFEHVFCGETGGRGRSGEAKLGGYHFWYVHYRHEQEGKAWYLGADYGRNQSRGMADPGIATGKFHWDADGNGGRPVMTKQPKGGFAIGHSAAAMLALGYVAGKTGIASPLRANLTGKSYRWTLYMDRNDSASLRTLWPAI